jgi:hypothetical protein
LTAEAAGEAIDFQEGATALLDRAGVFHDGGIVGMASGSVERFFTAARSGRVWSREPRL